MKKPVPEQVILVTGASSGLGGPWRGSRDNLFEPLPATALRTGASTLSHGARQRGRRFGFLLLGGALAATARSVEAGAARGRRRTILR
jgi:hypothetical protein